MIIFILLRNIILYVYVFLCFTIIGPLFIVWFLITRDMSVPYRVAQVLIKGTLLIAGIRVHIEGFENLPPPPVFFMANHQSMIEPPLLIAYLPYTVRVFPKKELFRIPIFAQLMKMARFVPVDRQNPEKARIALMKAIENLEGDESFLIFPEGTRTRTGKVLPFKRGGFVLSILGQIPIVPISVRGAFELMPKGSILVHPGVVEVKIHPPVPTEGLTLEDRRDLSEKVREIIRRAVEEDSIC